jgi:hypothetical protein
MSTLVAFASPSERSRHRRSLLAPTSRRRGPPGSSPDLVPPLVTLLAFAPLRRYHLVRPLPTQRRRSRSAPSSRGFHASTSRSARVVSHHLDGLLRTRACGSVAPRFRPWGSSRFRPRAPPRTSEEVARDPRGFPRDAVVTLQRVPLTSSRSASLRPLPPCRYRYPNPRRPDGHGARRARRRHGGPKATEAVLWFARGEPPHRLRSRAGPGHPCLVRSRSTRCSTTVRDLRCQRTCRAVSLREQPASRPCSTGESVVATPAVADEDALAPPMGFIPLQGPPGIRCRPCSWWESTAIREARCTLNRSPKRSARQGRRSATESTASRRLPRPRTIPPGVPDRRPEGCWPSHRSLSGAGVAPCGSVCSPPLPRHRSVASGVASVRGTMPTFMGFQTSKNTRRECPPRSFRTAFIWAFHSCQGSPST